MTENTTRLGSAVHGGIVVGVDGSEGSQEALRWALEHARRTGQTVHAVIAWDILGTYGDAYLIDHVDLTAESENTLKAAIEQVLAGAKTPRVEQHVDRGHPVQVLMDAAAGADLVVVGSRGHGGFAGMLLGSVSRHLAAHAPCPVVVVPPPQRRTA